MPSRAGGCAHRGHPGVALTRQTQHTTGVVPDEPHGPGVTPNRTWGRGRLRDGCSPSTSRARHHVRAVEAACGARVEGASRDPALRGSEKAQHTQGRLGLQEGQAVARVPTRPASESCPVQPPVSCTPLPPPGPPGPACPPYCTHRQGWREAPPQPRPGSSLPAPPGAHGSRCTGLGRGGRGRREEI